jgi:lipid II:glycine glycyltransferase (peptidoglycan interpeptide bridge formation enzyme)
MVKYRTRWKRYLELWFDEPEPAEPCDVVVRYRAPSAGRAGHSEEFHSLQVDLTKAPDEIFSNFGRSTRTQIRRSIERDDIRFEFFEHPTVDQMDEFREFYEAFARSRGVDGFHPARAQAHRASGRFYLSRVVDSEGTLTWHAHVCGEDSVSLMFSASHFRSGDDDFRNLVGRANRRLHWEEFQRFRGEGRRVYDFGGWYAGGTDGQLLSINRFKEGFNGKKVLLFTVIENRSLLAKLAASLQGR